MSLPTSVAGITNAHNIIYTIVYNHNLPITTPLSY